MKEISNASTVSRSNALIRWEGAARQNPLPAEGRVDAKYAVGNIEYKHNKQNCAKKTHKIKAEHKKDTH